jgi:hypothetical protein
MSLKYIEYGPRDTAPAPFSAGQGEFLGLVLKGDPQKLEALVNLALNAPFDGKGDNPLSPYTFETFTDAVLLFVGRWDLMVSMPRQNEGSANEEQISLWVPLKACPKSGKRAGEARGEIASSAHRRARKIKESIGHELSENSLAVAGSDEETICVTVPYMFVNNPMSLLNGREDYGYPKSLGRFNSYRWNDWSMGVEAFGGPLSRQSIAEWVRLIRVAQTDRLPPGVRKLRRVQEPPAAADEVFDAGVLATILKGGIDQIFIKQFRDAGDPKQEEDLACYRKLLRAPVTFQESEVSALDGEWQVEIFNDAAESHPITKDLGVNTDITPFAFELTSELELGIGEIIA